jgi:putative sigma-54 modulation protein
MSVTINNIGFSADDKLKEFIEIKLNKLNKFYNRITNSSVYLKLENSGQVRDKVVEVTVSVPGKVLVSKAEDKTFEGAVGECTSSLERQLKKYKEKMVN